MININLEGSISQPDPEGFFEQEPEESDLNQERLLLLKQSEIALGRLEIQKLELENLGADDFITKKELSRIETEIDRHKILIKKLSGEF